jgi:ribosomal protein L10
MKGENSLNKKITINNLQASLKTYLGFNFIEILDLKTESSDSIILDDVKEMFKNKDAFIILDEKQVNVSHLIDKWVETFPEYLV